MATLERDLVTRAQAEAIAEQTMVYYRGGLSGDSCDGLDRPPKWHDDILIEYEEEVSA